MNPKPATSSAKVRGCVALVGNGLGTRLSQSGAVNVERYAIVSSKAWDKLNELDRLIQQTLKLGMESGTFLKIEYIYGFELFNTRAYHNYETWSGGYRVTDEKKNIVVESEDLDDALLKWKQQRECEHDFAPLVPDGKAAWHCKLCGKRNPDKLNETISNLA